MVVVYCRSLREVAEEISKYKVDLAGAQQVRWDGGGVEPAGDCTFFYGHMKILLGDFNAQVGRDDIFKPTIGNES
ncbi:hypothetical protein B7P43_G01715 [Cryptotermes secundus]|uniref:Endonuclease/exonuclease/phosphatase domain-containing protein n=1 Tax=Cryptotermes secundus TaxID=105785 RepID=A0A2J7PDH4_9NEOP|nr:hypothetical protein B7P43_G01715 [Cryptotermes secundus]